MCPCKITLLNWAKLAKKAQNCMQYSFLIRISKLLIFTYMVGKNITD